MREDVVHADALRLIGMLSPRFALVQLPVLPLVSARSRWVSGHYLDEFSEAHAKSLLVREALGAALPSAGVGCAFNRTALGRIAQARGERPFDSVSLTEDYELGLRIGEQGGRGILVRMRDASGELIAAREYFPDTFAAAVRQKARWMIGIALAGWDRLGWAGGWREGWMRLRDRRAALAALVLAAAYLGFLLSAVVVLVAWFAGAAQPSVSPILPWLLMINFVLLVWRLLVRMGFVWQAYGVSGGSAFHSAYGCRQFHCVVRGAAGGLYLCATFARRAARLGQDGASLPGRSDRDRVSGTGKPLRFLGAVIGGWVVLRLGAVAMPVLWEADEAVEVASADEAMAEKPMRAPVLPGTAAAQTGSIEASVISRSRLATPADPMGQKPFASPARIVAAGRCRKCLASVGVHCRVARPDPFGIGATWPAIGSCRSAA